MGIISFLIKVFFFYIIYTIISGLIKGYQTYKMVQKQAEQGGGFSGNHGYQERKSYSEQYGASDGQTIDAEFKVINEKEV